MTSKPLAPPPADFDDAPELTDEQIKRLRPARELFAELGIPMPKPIGRPKAEQPKQSVTMRLDADVLDYFKSTGPGWQTRINDLLASKVSELKKSA